MKRKLQALLLVLAMLLSISAAGFAGNQATASSSTIDFEGGDGSADNPYQIADAVQLNNVRNHLAAHFILVDDIDLYSDYGGGWVPIGEYYQEGPFTGTFDGGVYEIRNLFIDWESDSHNPVGLFGYALNAVIKNVKLVDIDVTVTVTGDYYVDVGGLVGNPWQTSITGSSVTGRVYYYYTYEGLTDSYVGGLAGYSNDSTIINSFSGVVVEVNARWGHAGGLVGFNMGDSYISKSYATGNVNGEHVSGGLVGRNDGTIEESYATGDVSCNLSYAGGLIGENQGTISNSYATGDVEGNDESAGGLVGYSNGGTIENTYAAIGVVSGRDPFIGGLVGCKTGTITITASYFDMKNTDNDLGEPRSAEEMTFPYDENKDTYVDWDFDNIWGFEQDVNNRYPFLQWQVFSSGEFAGGNGTPSNPYRITTAAELNNVRNYLGDDHADKCFRLMSNIDLTAYLSSGGDGYHGGAGWEPIGSDESPFMGIFNGGGNTISGLFINRPDLDGVGLFGSASGTFRIRNLGLSVVDITGGSFVGGLAGKIADGMIENCHVTGDVSGNNNVGGLVGANWEGTISISYAQSDVTVTAEDVLEYENVYAGGLAGSNSYGNITNCYATGSVTGPDSAGGGVYVGGLAGLNEGTITNCYATGLLSGENVGGLAGCGSGEINDSFYDEETTGIGSGGLGAKETQDMMVKSTFTDAGWDFDFIWDIDENENYPHLRGVVEVATPDNNLRNRLLAKFGKPPGDIITNIDMLGFTHLHEYGKGITDLTGLEYALNLTTLRLPENNVSNLSPLAGLIKLAELDLEANQVSCLLPLAGLINLEKLNLQDNKIEDVEPLSGLTALSRLNLRGNKIEDIEFLSELANLKYLNLSLNMITDISPLSELANLDSLYLDSNSIEDFGHLSGLVNLKHLSLRNTGLEDISILAGMTKLISLDLGNNEISDISTLDPDSFSALCFLYIDYNYLDLEDTATMDIIDAFEGQDCYVLYSPQKMKVTEVDDIADINVSYGTELSEVGLPLTVNVTLSDGNTTVLTVIWDGGTPEYDGNNAGTYVFTGTLELIVGIGNPYNLIASVNVIVETGEPGKPGKPENPGKPEEPGNPENPGNPEEPGKPPGTGRPPKKK